MLLVLPSLSAAEEASRNGPDTLGTLLSLGLGLLVVLAAIFLCAWLARRVQGLQGGNNQAMKVVAVLSVGQRERVVLVDVAGQQLLLGVTPQSVRTLQVFEQPVITPQGSGNDFASKLQAMLSRNNSPGLADPGPGPDQRHQSPGER
ncbi:MAG: flagellar biosynthetic protein FliO [Halomonadaceae bacterium]|nr:MAG: flagellar biosynthetic protein FliO [Halomonadaceae bacterium]